MGNYMKEYKYIIEALASSDLNCIEHSFERFYLENYRIVCTTIVEYVRNIEDAEELTNDMFLEIFNDIYVLRTKPNIEAYLRKRAKFTAINFLNSARYKRQQRCVLSDEIVYNEMDKSPDNSYRTVLSDLKEHISPTNYIILEERLLYKTSFKTISEKLNMSINTVKSNYRRTIKKIQERMVKNDF